MFRVINEAAKAYQSAIPADQYSEPYMSMQELRSEMKEMTFLGCEEAGNLLGVAGYQQVKDTTLVRHVYVLPERQRRGIGTQLLNRIMQVAETRQILVGTWQAASWAITFYQKHGFTLRRDKDTLLRRYWKIPERQIELSVVLSNESTRFPIPST